jgi:hypothetical protein
MSDRPQSRRRGRPPADKKAPRRRPLSVQLPDGHHDYLNYLVTVKRWLGSGVNDAARYILIRELERMMHSDYHKKDVSE